LTKYKKSLFPHDDAKAEKKALLQVPEAQILKDCCNYLAALGYLWWRMPIGPIVRSSAKGTIFTKNALKGFPDIAGISKSHPGLFWACELKRHKAKTTEAQDSWQSRLLASGAYAFVAHSFPEFLEKLMEMEVQLGAESSRYKHLAQRDLALLALRDQEVG